MVDVPKSAKIKELFSPAEVAISLGLFLLALLPRAYDLYRFVTADEAKWVYRSARFLAAFLNGDFAATSVNLTPAVTTTWLGGVGLTLYYWFNQAALNMPFTAWLLSLPQFRTEMPLLVATRWPMVIFTSVGVVIIYWLTRLLFNRTLAVIAAAFVALDPHTVALSRILGHDAPVTMFMVISILLLLLAVKRVGGQGGRGAGEQSITGMSLLIILSGISAGLAFLSKAPALFLIPFVALVCLWQIWQGRSALSLWLKLFLLWIAVAYLTFVIVWPAAWVDPAGRPWAVIENAFLSATDQEEADSESFWLVPNLGPFYYIVNGGFKLSPLAFIGLILTLFVILKQPRHPRNRVNDETSNTQSLNLPISPSPIFWLLTFIVLFTIFMTLGHKRSPRYILPIFPTLAIIAAYGWFKLQHAISNKWPVAGNPHHASGITHHVLRITPPILLILAALIFLLPYAPYYFTYFNPLLGGSYTAPHLVKIGWGEGLDQVGRFLQREVSNARVGTAYASTVAPFFKGDLSSPTGDRLDYVVLYSKQVQSGRPSPDSLRYYDQAEPIFSVDLDGISYANVYRGPAVQLPYASASGPLNSLSPVGFRPLTPYGRIGEMLDVDVLWPADNPLPATSMTLSLEPASVLDTPDDVGKIVLAEAAGSPTPMADDLVVSRHSLMLPDDLERGTYALLIDGRLLGQIELRRFQPPPRMGPVVDAVFDNQIDLVGYQFTPAEDFIGVNIAWQALKSSLPDYTVFVQLLDAETNERVAGVDAQPVKGEWPTSRWVKNEVVVDKHLVAMPYGLQPGYYKVIVGLYHPETGRRLALPNGYDFWLMPWTFIRKE